MIGYLRLYVRNNDLKKIVKGLKKDLNLSSTLHNSGVWDFVKTSSVCRRKQLYEWYFTVSLKEILGTFIVYSFGKEFQEFNSVFSHTHTHPPAITKMIPFVFGGH